MKTKILNLIIFALMIFVPFEIFATYGTQSALAYEEKTCYARIEVKSGFGADFFKESKTESVFQIPNHYYVLATGMEGDFFKVTYKDELSGFVRKSDVTLVEGVPSNKYPTISLSARNNSMLYAFCNDNTEGSVLHNADLLTYYGEKQGAGLQTDKFGSSISTWYYARTSDFQFGYIYVNDVSKIPNIDRPADDPDLFLPSANPNFFVEPAQSSFSGLSLGTQIMLILAIGIPSLLILYFLIKPSKIMQTAKRKSQKKTKKRVSHGDYFEFDESEL